MTSVKKVIDEIFTYDIPRTKTQKAVSIYTTAVQNARKSLGDPLDKNLDKLLGKKNKQTKGNLFLKAVKDKDAATKLTFACKMMTRHLSMRSKANLKKMGKIKGIKSPQTDSAEDLEYPDLDDVADDSPSWFNTSGWKSGGPTKVQNGTGFAGSFADTYLINTHMECAKDHRVSQEQILAQMLLSTHNFLQPVLEESKDGLSLKLFGAMHAFLCPLLRDLFRSITWTDVVEQNCPKKGGSQNYLFAALIEMLSGWVKDTIPKKTSTALTLLLCDPLVDKDTVECEEFEVSSKLNDHVLVTLIAALDDQAQQFNELASKHKESVKGKIKDEKKLKEQFESLKEQIESLNKIRIRLGAMVRQSPQNTMWNAIKLAYCGKKVQYIPASKELSLHHLKVETSNLEDNYVAALGKTRVSSMEISDQHRLWGKNYIPSPHQSLLYSLSVTDKSDSGLPPNAMRRLQSELTGLATSLPVDWRTSIFLTYDEQRMDLLKVAIVGPDKTPYKNGLFIFDVKIPPTYPQMPPQVLLRTTGNDTVRFNPNLYEDGYVCLSLLGTWSGPGWSPTHSNLLQLFLSIQSLIFVEEPYFNEPGYDSHRDTAWGKKLSGNYDRHIRLLCLKWALLDHLENPPKGFENIFHTHIKMKAEEIKEQLIEWESLDPPIGQLCQKIINRMKEMNLLPDDYNHPRLVIKPNNGNGKGNGKGCNSLDASSSKMSNTKGKNNTTTTASHNAPYSPIKEDTRKKNITLSKNEDNKLDDTVKKKSTILSKNDDTIINRRVSAGSKSSKSSKDDDIKKRKSPLKDDNKRRNSKVSKSSKNDDDNNTSKKRGASSSCSPPSKKLKKI